MCTESCQIWHETDVPSHMTDNMLRRQLKTLRLHIAEEHTLVRGFQKRDTPWHIVHHVAYEQCSRYRVLVTERARRVWRPAS